MYFYLSTVITGLMIPSLVIHFIIIRLESWSYHWCISVCQHDSTTTRDKCLCHILPFQEEKQKETIRGDVSLLIFRWVELLIMLL